MSEAGAALPFAFFFHLYDLVPMIILFGCFVLVTGQMIQTWGIRMGRGVKYWCALLWVHAVGCIIVDPFIGSMMAFVFNSFT